MAQAKEINIDEWRVFLIKMINILPICIRSELIGKPGLNAWFKHLESREGVLETITKLGTLFLHYINPKIILTNREAMVYRLPQNALDEVLDSSQLADDTIKRLKAEPKYLQAKFIAAYAEDNPQAKEQLYRRLFSAQTTIRILELRQDQQLVHSGVLRAVIEQLVTSPLNETMTSIIAFDRLDGDRIAITYRLSKQGRPVLDTNNVLVIPEERHHVTMIVDLVRRVVEARGPSAAIDAATERFMQDLRRAGLYAEAEGLKVTPAEFHELRHRLHLRVRTETYRPTDAKIGGVGTVTLAAGETMDDLTFAERYQAEERLDPDRIKTRWGVTFERDKRIRSLQYNHQRATLTFRQGTVTEEDIQFVIQTLAEVKMNRIAVSCL